MLLKASAAAFAKIVSYGKRKGKSHTIHKYSSLKMHPFNPFFTTYFLPTKRAKD